MINITIHENQRQIAIEAKGHGGYGKAGTDIVCAGVSVLLYSWKELCLDLEREQLITILRNDEESGYINLWVDDPHGATDYAFQMLRIGLYGVSEQFPDNCRIEWG